MALLQRLQDTERRLVSLASRREDVGDFIVLRSERHPDWYQANMLELREPRGRSLADWEREFRDRFPDRPHVMLYIPEIAPFGSLIEEARQRVRTDSEAEQPSPLRMQDIAYMFARDADACTPTPDGLRVEAVESEADWDDLMAFSIEEAREEPWYADERSVRRFLETRRVITQQAGVEWLRLMRAGERTILARLGVFDHGGVSRLQSVGTAASFRRRGYAGALLSHAIRAVLRRGETEGLAVSTECDTQAQRLYARVGFKPVGTECWIMRFPT